MDVYGVVHHSFEEAVGDGDVAGAGGEMGGVGLGGEKAGVVVGRSADAGMADVDVATVLGEEAHTLGIVDEDVFNGCRGVGIEEYPRGGAAVGAHREAGPGQEARVLPWGGEGGRGDACNPFHSDVDVAGAVEYAAGMLLERYGGQGGMLPALTFDDEGAVAHLPFDPRLGTVSYDSRGGVVAFDNYLGDMGVGEVDAETAELAAGGVQEGYGEHAPVEEETGVSAVEDDVTGVLDQDSNRFGVVLVVVRDVELPVFRVGGMEVVLFGEQPDYQGVGGRFLRDGLRDGAAQFASGHMAEFNGFHRGSRGDYRKSRGDKR